MCRAALPALLLAVAACGGSADAPRATAGAAPGASTAASAPPLDRLPPAIEGDSAGCPKDGRWRQCSVAARLRAAGLVPHRRAALARLPFLTPAGVVYDVHQVEVRAFVYADEAAARREGDALDAIRVAPRGETVAWPTRATLVRAGNLIAVILATNERQIERVQLALEGGAPQPEPDAVTLPAARAR